jgi:subtilisin family serine protease
MSRRSVGLVLLFVFVFAGNLAAQRPDAVAEHYFVSFRGAMGPSDVALVRGQGIQVNRQFPEVDALEVVVRNPNQLAALQRNPRVEYIEEVPMRYPVGLSTTQLTPTSSNGLYGLVTSKAVDAHALGYSGANVDVGLADTAIDCNHPDIAANLGTRYIDKVG